MDGSAQGRAVPRWLMVVGGVLLVGWLLYELRAVLTPIFFAFLIAYMLDPVVDRFEAMKLPRAAGIAIVLTVFLGALGLFLLLVVPAVVRDAVAFVLTLPDKVETLLARLDPWLAELGYEIPHSIDELLAEIEMDTGELAGRAAAPVAAVLEWIVGGTASVLGAAVGLLMVPVFAAYLLYDFDRMIAGIRDLVPWRVRPFVVDVAREVDEVLGQFVRGQLIVMGILAALYAIGYSIVGIRLAVVIGLVAGLLSFIPYVGGAVALGLALLMAFLDFDGWGQVIGVGAVYGIVQLLEGFVITPKIVGDKVGLSAIWVLVALLIGGEVFGFMGVLLAVPAAAVVKIFVVRAVAWYRESRLFLDGAPEPKADDVTSGMLRVEGLPDDPDVAVAKATVQATEAVEEELREPTDTPPVSEADTAPTTDAAPEPDTDDSTKTETRDD